MKKRTHFWVLFIESWRWAYERTEWAAHVISGRNAKTSVFAQSL